MDITTITLIVGFSTLIIERIFSWALKVKKSECFGASVTMQDKCIES